MLSCAIYFHTFKAHNETLFTNRKNRTATYNFVFPFETPKLRKKSSSIHLNGTSTKKLLEYNNNAPSRKHSSIIGMNNYQISTSLKQHLNSNRNSSLERSNHLYHNNNNKEIKTCSQLKDKSFTLEYPSPVLRLKRNGSTGIVCNLFTKDKAYMNNNNSNYIIKQQYQYHQVKNGSVLLQDKRNNNSYLNSIGYRYTNKSSIKEEEKNEMRNACDKDSYKGCKKGNVLYPEICKKHGMSNIKKQILKDSNYIRSNNYKKKKIKLLIGKSNVS